MGTADSTQAGVPSARDMIDRMRKLNAKGTDHGGGGFLAECKIARPHIPHGKTWNHLVSQSGEEGEEAGVDGLHAEVAHDSQLDAKEWDAVAGGGQSAGLIVITVADPIRPLICPSFIHFHGFAISTGSFRNALIFAA